MSLSVLQMSAVMEGLSTTKTKRFKVKHPKRKLYRASEPLLSVFMWGLNHSVNELSHISIPVKVSSILLTTQRWRMNECIMMVLKH